MKYRSSLSHAEKYDLVIAGKAMKKRLHDTFMKRRLHDITPLDLTSLIKQLHVSNAQTSTLVSQKHKTEVKRNLFGH